MRERKTILVTGGSGVLGSALLPELNHHHVIAFTHRTRPPGASAVVNGDLSAPDLGLKPGTYARLCQDVDVVLHCAAVVDFSVETGAVHDLNVGGTENVLRFCRDAEAPLLYVSTAFVLCPRSARGRTEDDAASPDAYLDSKRAADRRVRESGVPHAIARPGVVIGDSVTGEIARFQGLHAFAAAVLRNRIPFLPGSPTALVDIVAQDLVARSIRAILDQGIARGFDGAEYWLTSGPRSVSTGRLIEIVAEAGQRHGLALELPRFISTEAIDRLIRPAFYDLFPPTARKRMDELVAMSKLFFESETFPSSLGEIPGGPAAPTNAEIEAAIVTSLDYLIRAKGIGAAPRVATA